MEQNRWKQAALTLCAAAALAACNQAGENPPAEESAQIVSGRVARHNFASEVVGVRAVSGDTAAAWSAVALDGSFSLELPAGAEYRMEVVTAAGSHGFVGSAGGSTHALSFAVCSAGAPFDVGHVHGWAQSDGEKPGDDCDDPPPPCDDAGNCCFDDGTCCFPDGSCCFPGGTCCAPGEPCEPPPCNPGPDGNCDPEPPCEPGPDGTCDPGTPPCDLDTGENCCDDPAEDGSCPGQPCKPGPDGTCDDPEPPPPCDPATGQNCCENPRDDGSCPDQPCEPGPDGTCDDPTTPCEAGDPNCCENPAPDGSCPGQCEPGPDGTCDDPTTPCEPGPDGNCDQPPSPCDDYDDPSCWPQPGTPPCAGVPDAESGAACWSDGAVPEKLIPDFGCG